MSNATSNDQAGLGPAGRLGHSQTGTADARTVLTFRRALDEWLDQHLDLDDNQLADIVLASDEALSNCADHAYRAVGSAGAMTLQIDYDPELCALAIRISDNGQWAGPVSPDAVEAPAVTAVRGRGILLMRALADECVIDGRHDGTSVRLRFYGCKAGGYDLSQAS